MKKWEMVLVFALLCAASVQATPVTFAFDRITANCPANIEGQLFVDVTATQSGVNFNFRNAGPTLSTISEIYFYDGALLGIYSIDDSLPNVDFENLGANVTPNNLPDYKPDKLVLKLLAATEAVTPEPANGVKPGEWVSVGFTLKSGKTYQNLLDDMAAGEVSIGIHVKAINCAVNSSQVETLSDSFISTAIPEPMTLAILGLGGLMLTRRQK
jgi:hypothetical protein